MCRAGQPGSTRCWTRSGFLLWTSACQSQRQGSRSAATASPLTVRRSCRGKCECSRLQSGWWENFRTLKNVHLLLTTFFLFTLGSCIFPSQNSYKVPRNLNCTILCSTKTHHTHQPSYCVLKKVLSLLTLKLWSILFLVGLGQKCWTINFY